jgi:hypothetical protein
MNSRLVATRLTRTADGRGIGVQKIYAASRKIGATKANFAVPSGLDATTAGPSLLDALNALLTSYTSSGVPSEHAYNAKAAAFQQAWNADPTVAAAGATAMLDVDGGYGPNTHDAVAAVNGGSAPDVNTTAAPAGSTPASTTVVPGSSSSSSASIMAGMPTWGLWLVGLAAVGGAYLVGKSAMEQHGGKMHAHAMRTHRQLRHHARRLARRHRR